MEKTGVWSLIIKHQSRMRDLAGESIIFDIIGPNIDIIFFFRPSVIHVSIHQIVATK